MGPRTVHLSRIGRCTVQNIKESNVVTTSVCDLASATKLLVRFFMKFGTYRCHLEIYLSRLDFMKIGSVSEFAEGREIGLASWISFCAAT